VDPAFRKTGAARGILRQYRAVLWAFGIAAIGLQLTTEFSVLSVLLQIGGFLCALIAARRQVMAYAASPNPIVEVDLAASREVFPGGLFVASLPVGSLAVLSIWAAGRRDRLPARLPVHWGLNGPDLWIENTPVGVYGFLGIHAAM